jgi:hypothetical protein
LKNENGVLMPACRTKTMPPSLLSEWPVATIFNKPAMPHPVRNNTQATPMKYITHNPSHASNRPEKCFLAQQQGVEQCKKVPADGEFEYQHNNSLKS